MKHIFLTSVFSAGVCVPALAAPPTIAAPITAQLAADPAGARAAVGLAGANRQPVQLIGTRTGSAPLGIQSNGHLRWNQRMEHWFPYGASSIQLILPGWSQTNSLATYRGELTVPPSIYYLKGIKAITSGGIGYGVGDYLVMPTWGNGLTPAVVMVDAVSAGAVTSAHVVRGGAYSSPLADNTAPMAIWQAGFGYGAYSESNGFTGSNMGSAYNSTTNSGGFNYVAANTFVSVAPGPGCTGGTISASVDPLTGAITGTLPGGTWTCTTTNNGNAVFAISSGATSGGLGSGFTATMDWGTAAYMARISIDPDFATQTCSNNITGACAHRTVTASTGHPANTGQDVFGLAGDIYVQSGDSTLTDPTPVNIPVGSAAGVRMMLFGNWPRGRYTQTAGEVGLASASTYDMTQSGTFASSAATNVAALQPLAIIGQPLVSGPSLLAIADSRGAGIDGLPSPSTYDVYDTAGGAVSWLERAVNNTMPMLNISRSGDAMYGWMRNRQQRFKLFRQIAKAGKFPELCYVGLSVNDFGSGSVAFTTLQPEEAQLVSDLRGFGCKFVFTDTTDPWTSSTSTNFALMWADVANGGSGYTPNSTFPVTLAGGTFTTQGQANVTTNASGVVVGVSSIAVAGAYTVKPSGAVATTGGTGTGLTLTPYLTNFSDTASQTPTAFNGQIQLRNAQLRATGMGSYAGIYDAFVDTAGITESAVASGVWALNVTYDGAHMGPAGLVAKAALLAPRLPGWAAIAASR